MERTGRGGRATARTANEADVGEIVRTILEDAGPEGIGVKDFYNHESLVPFSHPEIDEKLRETMNRLDVTLGGTATKFCWVR